MLTVVIFILQKKQTEEIELVARPGPWRLQRAQTKHQATFQLWFSTHSKFSWTVRVTIASDWIPPGPQTTQSKSCGTIWLEELWRSAESIAIGPNCDCKMKFGSLLIGLVLFSPLLWPSLRASAVSFMSTDPAEFYGKMREGKNGKRYTFVTAKEECSQSLDWILKQFLSDDFHMISSHNYTIMTKWHVCVKWNDTFSQYGKKPLVPL